MNSSEVATVAACDCCTGVEQRTPVAIENRPGLSAIAYRVGSHGDFLASLHARLSSHDYPALRTLRTRESDDYSLALLDAFAVVADVLTFYQERMANESYLRTASERGSLAELAQLVGYCLRPGVGAETWVAFTLEEAKGAPEKVTAGAGIKVQSVPGPGELPQTFETVEPLEARPAWNALEPRTRQPQTIGAGTTFLLLEGTASSLSVGDAIVIVHASREESSASTRWDFRVVEQVQLDVARNWTRVSWSAPLDQIVPSGQTPTADFKVYALRQRAALFGHNAPDPKLLSVIGTKLADMAFGLEAVSSAFFAESDVTASDELPAEMTQAKAVEWKGFKISKDQIDLDTVYPKVVAGGWVVLTKGGAAELVRAVEVTSLSRANFGLSLKVTRIIPDKTIDSATYTIQGTTAFVFSEELPVAEAPVDDPLEKNDLILATRVEGLRKGQWLAVSGHAYESGRVISEDRREVAQIDAVDEVDGRTRLRLDRDLGYEFVRETVAVNANVARATHGETVREVLGSGDGSLPHQRFELKHAPLTFVGAVNEAGAASTLEVRVDELRWHENASLFAASPDARAYVLRPGGNGKARVQFGDGRRGVRLPTGRENVRAIYRKGIGAAGNVIAGSLTQLMTRPLGLKTASNPLAAEGGTDPESAAHARRNIPIGVRTLGRAVSVLDYEDFARGFGGIAKAHATVLNLRAGPTVFVTIAGEDGARPAPEGPVLTRLAQALEKAGDPFVRFEVHAHDEAFFRLALKIKRHPDHDKEQVFTAVTAALTQAFSFEIRQFGQMVALSEVVAVVEDVPGVMAVDVDRFYRGSAIARADRLLAAGARVDTQGNGAPAELLLLASGPLDYLEEMS